MDDFDSSLQSVGCDVGVRCLGKKNLAWIDIQFLSKKCSLHLAPDSWDVGSDRFAVGPHDAQIASDPIGRVADIKRVGVHDLLNSLRGEGAAVTADAVHQEQRRGGEAERWWLWSAGKRNVFDPLPRRAESAGDVATVRNDQMNPSLPQVSPVRQAKVHFLNELAELRLVIHGLVRILSGRHTPCRSVLGTDLGAGR